MHIDDKKLQILTGLLLATLVVIFLLVVGIIMMFMILLNTVEMNEIFTDALIKVE